jgi:hypothetical protein
MLLLEGPLSQTESLNMKIKSTWLSAALISAAVALPSVAVAQSGSSGVIRGRAEAARARVEQSRIERQRAERIEQARRERDRWGIRQDQQIRSCSQIKGDKSAKKRCQELRKEEKRLAKLQKRREFCAQNTRAADRAKFCRDDDVNGRSGDVYGRDNGTWGDIIFGRGESTTRPDRRTDRRPGVHIPGL